MVYLSELLIVVDENFHFDEIVIEGGKVQKGSVIFIRHDAKVELGVFFEVVFEILEGSKGRNLIDRFIHSLIYNLLML